MSDPGGPTVPDRGGRGTGETVLAYDLIRRGHNLEHLHRLVRYRAARGGPGRLVVVCHPEYRRRYGDPPEDSSVALHHPDPELRERGGDGEGGAVLGALREWRLLRRMARRFSPDRLLLMYLNLFQLPLSVPGYRRLPCAAEGILFSPPVYYASDREGAAEAVRSRTRRLRGRLQLRAVARAPALKRVHLMTSPDQARALDRLLGDRVEVRYICDPVPDGGAPSPDPRRWTRRKFGLEEGRRVLTLCGRINGRKGAREVLRACLRLPEGAASGSALLLAGQVERSVRNEVVTLLGRVRRERPDLQVVAHEGFLSDTDFGNTVAGSDALLLAYQQTHGSSGLLGWAAKLHTPVVGPRSGLQGRLIREYGLGLSANVSDPEPLAGALARAAAGEVGVDEEGAARYAEERTSERFAASLLGAAPAGRGGASATGGPGGGADAGGR